MNGETGKGEKMNECKTCYWWEKMEDDVDFAQNNGNKRGRCHRNPPAAMPLVLPKINQITRQMEPAVVEMTVWPITMNCAYCGEHKVVLEKALA